MSELCCAEADETAGAEHAIWCPRWDVAAALAAARESGYAQARDEDIAALRDESAHLLMLAHYRDSIEGCRCGWADLGKSHVLHVLDHLADYLASLTPTQEAPNDDHF
jgi:hypothetical protein